LADHLIPNVASPTRLRKSSFKQNEVGCRIVRDQYGFAPQDTWAVDPPPVPSQAASVGKGKQLCGRYAQRSGQFLDASQAHISGAALDIRNIRPMQISSLSQHLLS